MTNFVCVLKSRKMEDGHNFDVGYSIYLPEHVLALRDQVSKYFSKEHRFIVFTDYDKSYFDGMNCEVIPLIMDLAGWWSKIEMFRPDIYARFKDDTFVYFDLDTVIVNNIDEIADYPHDLSALMDINLNSIFPGRLGSGIMAWRGDHTNIFTEFCKNIEGNIERYYQGGDQHFIHDLKNVYMPIQRIMKGVYDFKLELTDDQKSAPPIDAKIIYFRGSPKPWQLEFPWCNKAMYKKWRNQGDPTPRHIFAPPEIKTCDISYITENGNPILRYGDERKVTFVTVLKKKEGVPHTGGVYGPVHVHALQEQIKKYYPHPHDFVCFTDVPEVPGKKIRLEYGLPGWWSKIEMYKLKSNNPNDVFIYLDLDIVITGDLSRIVDYPHDISAFSEVEAPGMVKGCFCSCIVAWRGDHSDIYREFMSKPKFYMGKYHLGGDQHFTWALRPNYKPIQEIDSGVYDYKYELMDGPRELPENTTMVHFHLEPKPWYPEIDLPWVDKEIYAELPEVI